MGGRYGRDLVAKPFRQWPCGQTKDVPALELTQPPTEDAAAGLLAWRPDHGIISLCIDTAPQDRGEPWRAEVKNGLREVAGAVSKDEDRETALALRSTVDRIEEELAGDILGAEARCVIGFVAADRDQPESRWYATELAPGRTEVRYGPVPQLSPLLRILDRGAARGVAALSSERVRLFDSRLGHLEEVHSWELEVFALDWRERKSQRPPDPGRGQGTAAAGKDQYGERLDHNRARFIKETAGLTVPEAKQRGWTELLTLGDAHLAEDFAAALSGADPRHVDDADVVSEPTGQVQGRVNELVDWVSHERERRLIAEIKDRAMAGGKGALGPQEAVQALEEGRVEHLVYDADRDLPERERMIEMALTTSARITPVDGDVAAELEEQQGVAALLRY